MDKDTGAGTRVDNETRQELKEIRETLGSLDSRLARLEAGIQGLERQIDSFHPSPCPLLRETRGDVTKLRTIMEDTTRQLLIKLSFLLVGGVITFVVMKLV